MRCIVNVEWDCAIYSEIVWTNQAENITFAALILNLVPLKTYRYRGRVARQRSAKPFTAVRICSVPHQKAPFAGLLLFILILFAAMKYSQSIGILAAIALCVACFYPWTYHPDLDKYFTGLFSYQNSYGKPGKLMIALAVIAISMFALNKLWAKRVNWLICAILAAYALKTYLLFTTCYRGICPAKQPAVYVMIFSSAIMLVMAFLPRINQSPNPKPKTPNPKQP